MLRDFCTRSYRKIVCALAALAFVFATLPLDSQNSTGSSRAEAVLHIRVNVVPVVMIPAARQVVRADSVISYNMPARLAKLSVSEEVRPLAPGDGLPVTTYGSLVRVTTVVAN